jgi:hypothetical protein
LLTSLPASPLRGARTPRVNTHPPYARTYGPEAVVLASLAGLDLDAWQQDALHAMLAVRSDGKWACFEYAEIVARQNGKGGILEARVLAGMFLLGERLIMWSAHEYKTAMEAFRRVLVLLRTLGTALSDTLIDVDGVLVKVNNTNGEESFERLDTGQRIKFIARSKSSGRGFSGDLNIIDEAFAYTLAQQAALMPTMSARPNPQIVYTSSPPLDGESGDVLFNLRERGEAGGDDSLGWRDWGAAGNLSNLDKIDLDNREMWAATNPAVGIRITEETIARERRSMGALEFARERCGIWPQRASAAGVVLDPKLWVALVDPASKRAGELALAVDVTPMRDYASIGLYGPRADGREHMQLVDYRPGTDWVVPRLIELKAALDPVAIALDAKNGAMAFVDDLALAGLAVPDDPEKPQRGDLLITGAAEIAAAVGQFIDGFRASTPGDFDTPPAGYVHLGQEPLDNAIKNVRARPIGDAGAIAWGRKASEVDIGPVMTVTLARYAYLTRINVKDKTIVLTGSLMA